MRLVTAREQVEMLLPWRTAMDVSDYGVQHRPTVEYGTPMHNLDSRYYENLRYHADDDETYDTLLKAQGNPDHQVTVYRSAPHESGGRINTGDWVTTSKDYADQHGSVENGRGWPTFSTTVRASDLYNDGNSLQEYGYHGPGLQGVYT